MRQETLSEMLNYMSRWRDTFSTPSGVEVSQRRHGDTSLYFVLNSLPTFAKRRAGPGRHTIGSI
jgi:hypothetical protein